MSNNGPGMSPSPVAAATLAGDQGRKPHELPWLYLDSVGQEYGPIPGWTMREWLQLGRFPVGRDLRVRLPEWERHLPLHQLYADRSTVFLLPPAWPDVYADGVLEDSSGSSAQTNGTRALPSDAAVPVGSGLPQPPAFSGAPIAALQGGRGMQGHDPSAETHQTAAARAEATAAGVAAGLSAGDPRLPARLPPQARPVAQELSEESEQLHRRLQAEADALRLRLSPPPRDESPPPQPQFVLERLMQEQQLLPLPPPQPSQRQLRELLSQPQEGPLLWEDGPAAGDAAALRNGQRPAANSHSYQTTDDADADGPFPEGGYTSNGRGHPGALCSG